MNNDNAEIIQQSDREHISYLPEYMSTWRQEIQSEVHTENIVAVDLSREHKTFPIPLTNLHYIQVTVLVFLIVVAGTIGVQLHNRGIFHQPVQIHTTTTPTAAISRGFTIVHNSSMGISMEYPATWTPDATQTMTAGNGIGFGISTSTEYAHIVILQISPATSITLGSVETVNTQVFQYFRTLQNINNFQTIQSTSAMSTIASAQWGTANATFTDASGTAYQLTTLAVSHNAQYYNIYYVVLAQNYTQTVSQYIQPMLHSFTFSA